MHWVNLRESITLICFALWPLDGFKLLFSPIVVYLNATIAIKKNDAFYKGDIFSWA